MSIQDKIERILKEIHILFSQSQTYERDKGKIVVEKQEIFGLLEQLSMAVYEVMDEYQVTSQKHEMSERRSQKRGEEIISKANQHADDIYAASMMYTDDALSRIQYIMEDANKSVERIFRKLNTELGNEKERVRQNQFEIKEQLRDFADTDKYLRVIEELDQERERERREKSGKSKEKRIQNEGKSYSVIQPEIKINKAYFEHVGKHYDEAGKVKEEEEDISKSLSKVTGKEFAESLRKRAAMGSFSEEREEKRPMQIVPEVKVNLDAPYFKQKQAEGKDRRFPFGKK